MLEVILPEKPAERFTFWELKDWVQWYKTSLSWALRAGSVGS